MFSRSLFVLQIRWLISNISASQHVVEYVTPFKGLMKDLRRTSVQQVCQDPAGRDIE